MDEEVLLIKIPRKLLAEVDRLTELMGYETREKFIESAVRRLVNQYMEKIRLVAAHVQA
jgi:metal-responsive CopG/Arc/MetJ family transcriptional regulator